MACHGTWRERCHTGKIFRPKRFRLALSKRLPVLPVLGTSQQRLHSVGLCVGVLRGGGGGTEVAKKVCTRQTLTVDPHRIVLHHTTFP